MAKTDVELELERLRKENEALKAGQREFNMKVAEKGGLSVYGLGRFPLTLYKEQWLELFRHIDEIKAFIKANDAKLKSKK